MTTEVEFRAKHEARVIEAMAYAIAEADGTTDSYEAMARAALDAYRAAAWMPMSEAPKEGTIMIASYAPTNWSYWPTTVHLMGIEKIDAGRLKYGRACMPLPLPPTEEPK